MPRKSSLKTTGKYNSTKLDRNLESFRFGLQFSDTQIAEIKVRDPIANFLTFGISQEALGDGFIIYKPNGDVIDNMEDWTDYFENTQFLDKYIKLIADSRSDGLIGCLVFEDGSFRSFIKKHLDFDFDFNTRKLNSVACHEYYDQGGLQEYIHNVELSNDPEIDPFFLVYHQMGDKTFEGKSALEPVYDIINSLWILDFMAGLYGARVAGGIKIYKVNSSDAADRATALASLRDLSYKMAMVIDNDEDFKLYTGEGTGVNFQQLKDVLFDSLVAATGIPKNKWKGELPGEPQAGKIIRKSYIEILKTIQDRSTFYLKRLLKLVANLTGRTLPDKFSIGWNFKEEPTEKEKAEVLNINSQSLVMLAKIMTGAELRTEFKLKELDYFNNIDIPLEIFLENQKVDVKPNVGINSTGSADPTIGDTNPADNPIPATNNKSASTGNNNA
jgi:hypothetical protein